MMESIGNSIKGLLKKATAKEKKEQMPALYNGARYDLTKFPKEVRNRLSKGQGIRAGRFKIYPSGLVTRIGKPIRRGA